MLFRKLTVTLLLAALLVPGLAFGQSAGVSAPKETIEKIRDEGMNRSQVMNHLSYLTDVIGSRLTNSPGMKQANEWTRDTMAKWGMKNSRLEAWGPFGRGWSLKEFSAQMTSPNSVPVIAFPKAWSPSTKGVINSEIVHVDVKTDADFDKYKGKLNGKIVFTSDIRDLKADFDGMGTRYSEKELAEMEAATPAPAQRPAGQNNPEQAQRMAQQRALAGKMMGFLIQEGAAVLVDNSRVGSGGTLFVSGAAVAQDSTSQVRVTAYQKESESKMVPQMTMATEDYNRIIRMIKQGVTPRMSVNIQAQYHDEDLMGYNTTAELPGTDLKDEIVMLGGHMDSWHASTGATDNAAGVAVAMEAVRILIALGLKPRRTIRVGLWSGEEQGLNGSREYVKQHFGEMKGAGNQFGPPNPSAPKPELVKGAEYEKLSAYYNLDNGTGKIRGVYLQGNSAVGSIFKEWLMPFSDLGAKTLTISNTGGTDHLSFDRIGLPGFQFIQDEIEYDTRTHHSNQDNYDRIQSDDMKQAATIMAAFIYQTAMMDQKIPRKPMP
jgi:carboxypeptidase Q